MTALLAATISVADLRAAVDRYHSWFDYSLVESGKVSASLAAAWSAPNTAGRAMAVMRPASGTDVFIRFVEAPRVADYQPLRSYGWAAIELCIEDVAATYAQMKVSPFQIIGAPQRMAGLARIHPMQVVGPDGEVIFLTQTQIGGPSPRHPVARAPVDMLFIAVLATRDMPATAEWFRKIFGLGIDPPLTLPYGVLSRAFGLAPEHIHQLTTVVSGQRVLVEVDEYPAQAVQRPQLSGELAPGVSMASITYPRLDDLQAEWICAPARRDGAIYNGALSGVLRTPEGALVEVIEHAPTV